MGRREEKKEREKEKKHEGTGQLVVVDERRMKQHRHLCCFDELAMATVSELVCVIRHATALAAPTAHLAAYHNKEAQLIRPQSERKA